MTTALTFRAALIFISVHEDEDEHRSERSICDNTTQSAFLATSVGDSGVVGDFAPPDHGCKPCVLVDLAVKVIE